MKWPGIAVAVVVSLGLIVAIGYLITYLHPANQDIKQEMDDDHDDWEGKQEQGGQGGVGAGRGGRGAGRYKKQEVDTETHGALEFHLLEINEKEEGGESGGPGLGETVIVAIISVASLMFLCIISGCIFGMWKCGLCPEGRRRRRSTSSRSLSAGSGRKRTHDIEDSEIGELRLKLRKLEEKSAKKEEEQEKREQEQEKREQEKREMKEKELEMREEEAPKTGLRAITSEVGSLPDMDDMDSVSMEDYSKRLDQATKLIKDIEKARMVVNHHKDNIRPGTTLGYIGGGGAGGR